MNTFSAIGLALSAAILCLGGNAMAPQQVPAASVTGTVAPSATAAPAAQPGAGVRVPMMIFFG